MNWRRIWSGSLVAGLVVVTVEFVVNHVVLLETWHDLQRLGLMKQAIKPYAFPIVLLQSWMIGFILTWLYVLARPRLGPGPKTALVMGSLVWFLLWVPYGITQWLWLTLPAKVGWVGVIGGLVECWVGTYLAGWQYIEKAP